MGVIKDTSKKIDEMLSKYDTDNLTEGVIESIIRDAQKNSFEYLQYNNVKEKGKMIPKKGLILYKMVKSEKGDIVKVSRHLNF